MAQPPAFISAEMRISRGRGCGRGDGDGACAVHVRNQREAGSSARPEVGRRRERDGDDLRPESGRDFLRRQLVALARELYAATGLSQFCAEALKRKAAPRR